jgi:hypothetical protein
LAFLRIVRAIRDAIVCYDQQIETLAREHPDFTIIDSLPGAGPALAPRPDRRSRASRLFAAGVVAIEPVATKSL